MCFRPPEVNVHNICPECGFDNVFGEEECEKCGAELDGGHVEHAVSVGDEETIPVTGISGAPGAPKAPGAPGAPRIPGAPGAPVVPKAPTAPSVATTQSASDKPTPKVLRRFD